MALNNCIWQDLAQEELPIFIDCISPIGTHISKDIDHSLNLRCPTKQVISSTEEIARSTADNLKGFRFHFGVTSRRFIFYLRITVTLWELYFIHLLGYQLECWIKRILENSAIWFEVDDRLSVGGEKCGSGRSVYEWLKLLSWVVSHTH